MVPPIALLGHLAKARLLLASALGLSQSGIDCLKPHISVSDRLCMLGDQLLALGCGLLSQS